MSALPTHPTHRSGTTRHPVLGAVRTGIDSLAQARWTGAQAEDLRRVLLEAYSVLPRPGGAASRRRAPRGGPISAERDPTQGEDDSMSTPASPTEQSRRTEGPDSEGDSAR